MFSVMRMIPECLDGTEAAGTMAGTDKLMATNIPITTLRIFFFITLTSLGLMANPY